MNAFSHLTEQVLYTRKLNLATPFSFKRNLIMYSITNSKTAVKLQNSWENSGSYTTVHDILTSKVDPKNCPDEDVHNPIDNNQKVGMCTWKIREGSTVPLSICTTLGHILPQPPTSMQNKEFLMPRYWLDKEPIDKILVQVEALEKQALEEFRNYRDCYVREVIVQVEKEFHRELYFHDYVDIAVANKGKVNTCCKCEHTYKNDLTICSNCHNNDTIHDIDHDPYYRTLSNHPREPPKIVIGEPCMVNPNSIEVVRRVMEHVQDVDYLNDELHERKWRHSLIVMVYHMCMHQIFKITCLNVLNAKKKFIRKVFR